MTSTWRAERNAKALARLERAMPAIFPGAVRVHAYARALTPPTPRLAVESYWREHPLRADRLARALAGLSDAPKGWRWRLAAKEGASFRSPPAPYRERAFAKGPGHCCICGQPVFRYGWHADLWGDGAPNKNARWHSACVSAWKLWTAPNQHVKALRKRQGRLCPETGKRLLRAAEVDHRVPLYQVWRDRRDTPWPELLGFWGVPNLQVINVAGHTEKSVAEIRERAASRALAPPPPDRDDEKVAALRQSRPNPLEESTKPGVAATSAREVR